MAQRVQVLLEDDFDGGTADETVTFALDGAVYEIDLKSVNAEKLRALLAPYVEKGRKQRGQLTTVRRGAGRGAGRPAAGASDTAKIRVWAKENGYEVNDRGRVAAHVREAYGASIGAEVSPKGTTAARPAQEAPAQPAPITDEDRDIAAVIFRGRKKVGDEGIEHLRKAQENGGEFVRRGSSAGAIIKALVGKGLGKDGYINGAGLAYLELADAAGA